MSLGNATRDEGKDMGEVRGKEREEGKQGGGKRRIKGKGRGEDREREGRTKERGRGCKGQWSQERT